MDTPSPPSVPLPRRGRAKTPDLPEPTLHEDRQRDERVRYVAELLLDGTPKKHVLAGLQERFGVSLRQAEQDLRDVRTYAQRALGDEDNIAAFVLHGLGRLNQVAEKVYEDAVDDLPDEVLDAETGLPTEVSVETRIKHRQQRAASARAFADITKTSFLVVGARSRHYSPRAKEVSEAENLSPEQQAALDNFWSEEG
jgi:hypothetical protein